MQHTISEGANPTPYKATGFGSVNSLYFILGEEAEEAAVDGIDVKNAKYFAFSANAWMSNMAGSFSLIAG